MQESSHAVIVTPQLPHAYHNGGIGTFAWAFAQVLCGAGHKVTVVYTEPLQFPKHRWISHYARLGIDVVCLREQPIEVLPGKSYLNTLSEHVASVIPPDADVVYFADWRANALHYVRSRRFSGERRPLAVTVLHGCSQWDRYGQRRWPSQIESLVGEHYERYSVEHSDVVIAASEYMLGWARHHWTLPPGENSSWLHYPFVPVDHGEAPAQYSAYFERVVFFGRLESRKGFDLFVEALKDLADDVALLPVREIVFLGADNVHPYGTAAQAAALVEQYTGIPVTHEDSLSSAEAQQYLADHRSDTLVVMPSRFDNLPFAVIEASLVRGLNLLSTRVGGIPEILGAAAPADVLAEPFRRPFRNALRARLARGPARETGIAPYPWKAHNAAWVARHESLVAQSRALSPGSARRDLESRPATPLVDVCVPHYNLGSYLGMLLDSLEKQTFEAFSVTVIDDGSTDPQSVEAFERLRRRYEPRGWRFIRTANAGVCAARNAAARAGTAPYVIFMDADNVALPTMIADFVASIQTSGDDCLTCHMYLFKGEGSPLQGFDAFGAPRPVPLAEMYVPIGNARALGIVVNPFGDGNFIMRRTVFDELGGFSEAWHRDVGVEDQELLTLASLSGYKLDVIPRALFFYRWREDGRNNTSDPFENQCRVARVYEERLRTVGLEGLASLILGLEGRAAALEDRAPAAALESESLEDRRMRLWRQARAQSHSSEPAFTGPLRMGDIDFTRELKWIGSAPKGGKAMTTVTASGVTIPAMEMHPWYPALPQDVSVATQVSIPNDLRGCEVIFAAALDESGRGLGGGVALRFETLAGEWLATLPVGSSEASWKLIAIQIPYELRGGAIRIVVEALASSNYCTTYVAVLGAGKSGAEQRAGLSAWLSRSDHEPLDTVEGLHVGIPHGAIRGYDGKPLKRHVVDRDGVRLSAIHMHPGRPPEGAEWSPLARVECVAETAGTEWLILWTMPVVPEGLFRLVEVTFSLNDRHLLTRSFGSGFGENWNHVWLTVPDFHEPSELIVNVSPLSVADYATVFVALAGYRAVRPSNPSVNGTLDHDRSRTGFELSSSSGP